MATLFAHDRIQALLSDGNGRTHKQIADELGVNEGCSRTAMRKLREANLVRICDWVPASGVPGIAACPIFTLGSAPDKPRPKPMDQATRMKVYKHKVAERQRQERLYNDKNRPIARDPFVAALFGTRESMDPTPLPSHVHQWPMDVSDELEAA
jgi:hypothetical protein